MINRFRSGRLSHQHIGITSFTEDKLVLGVIGNANISNDLTVGGDLNVPSIIVSGTGTIIGDDITTRNLDVTGIATFHGNVGIAGTLTYEDVTNIDSVGLITARSGLDILSGTIGAGNTVGKNGSYLKSTGVGVTWTEFPNLRETVTFSATQDQTVITTNYNPGFVDIFYNGVKLTPGEYNASNGTSIILESPAVVNDVIEIVTYATIGSYTGSGDGGFGGASVTVSDTPPTTPNGGDLWWSSNEAQLKIYYIDDNSSQWVDASSNGGGGIGGSGGVSNFLALSDTPGSYTADKWLKVNSAGNALEFTDAPSGGSGSDNYVDTVSLSGTDLVIGRTGALADLTVDLSSLGGGGGSEYYVDTATLTGTDLVLGRTGSLADLTVDLSSLGGGGSDTNDYVDTASLSGTDLVIGRTGALADITVDLSSLGGGGGGIAGINTLTQSYFNHIEAVGIVTAQKFVGDGSLLTNLSSGITDVVEDTTPQLGGDLDLNNRTIQGTGIINFSGPITATGNISGADITGDNLTVVNGTIYNNGGHTQLNTLNVSGISTVVGVGTFKDNVYIDKTLYVGEKLFVDSIEITTGQTIGEDIVTRNFKASGISTFQNLVELESQVVFEGTSYNAKWDPTNNKLQFYDNAKVTFGSNDDFWISNGGSATVFNQVGAATSIEIQQGSIRKFDINQSGVIVSGIATATKFVGDGSLLTNLPTLELNDLDKVSVSNPSDGHVLKWDDALDSWVASADLTSGGSGSTTVIVPVAHAYLTADTAGTGTGISWGAYNSSNNRIEFTFATAQPDANYFVLWSREQYAQHEITVTNKTTTGFRTTWTNNDGSDLPPSYFAGGLVVYASTPTTSVGGGSGTGGIEYDDLSLTSNTASSLNSLTYSDTTGAFVFTPYALPKATTSTLGGVTVDNTTIQVDANGELSAIATSTLSGLTDTIIGTAQGSPTALTSGDIIKWNGTKWYNVPLNDAIGIPVYNNTSLFPAANANTGQIAYSNNDGAIYHSNGTDWTSHRVVTTNNTYNSDLATLLIDYERKYNLLTGTYDEGSTQYRAARRLVTLQDVKTAANTDYLTLAAGTGLTISNTVNAQSKPEISFAATGGNYSLSAVDVVDQYQSKIRLTDSISSNTSDLLIKGQGGIEVKYEDASTLIIKTPTIPQEYTDDKAKDAASLMFTNNNSNHSNIQFTYNSTTKLITAQATGGAATDTTYTLSTRSTSSTNAFIDLTDSNDPANVNSVEFKAGPLTYDSLASNAPVVSYTAPSGATPAKITVGALVPIQPDWSQTDDTALDYIKSKPATFGGESVGLVPSSPANETTKYLKSDGSWDTISIPSSIDDLDDVDTTTSAPSPGNILKWDSTANSGSGAWTPQTDSSSGGATNIDDLEDVDIDQTAADNGTKTALQYDTVSDKWINVASTAIPSIEEKFATSSSIVSGDDGNLTIQGYRGYVLYKIKASVASWVRIYCDVASRDSDATRSHGNDPLPGSGVIAEVTTTSADEEILLTPGVMGFNNDSSVSTNIYLAINNRSGSAAAVTVTLTVLKIGE